MPDPTSPTAPPRGPWRNPVFLLVFVPGAAAWLVAFGWLTWRYYTPVAGWVGGLNEILQEVVGTALLLVWAVVLAFGLGGAGMLAERVAGVRPPVAEGQTHGQHAKWERPD